MNAPYGDLDLATTLGLAVRGILADEVHTSLPGVIETYDVATCKASVKPLISKKYPDGTVVSLPILPSVPVIWPKTLNGGIHIPLKKGDGVAIFFAERCIDEWLSGGSEGAPSDLRKFHFTDAYCVPGLHSFSVDAPFTNGEDLEIVFKGKSVFIRENGDIEISGGNKLIVRDNGDIEIGESSLKALVNESFQDIFNSHVHNYMGFVGTGTPTPGITGTPASTTGTGAISPGACPGTPPTGAFGVSLGAAQLTSKVKAQ
jgi:hypothetical protein